MYLHKIPGRVKMIKAKDTAVLGASTTGRADTLKVGVTIVGVGNEFRGDDAVGLMVLKSLKEKVPSEESCGADVKTVELTGDQSHLLELMHSTDAMIIIDAVQSAAPAGTIFRVDASEEPIPKEFFSFSTHSIDSAQAIELARALNELPAHIFIYGIVGKDFSYTSKLSTEVKESIEIVETKILNDINCILKNESHNSDLKSLPIIV